MAQVYPDPAAAGAPGPPGEAGVAEVAVPAQQTMMMAGIVPGDAPPKSGPRAGISETALKNSIEPLTCFMHDLLPGETLLATYDVHMPSLMMPAWKFWLYTICTLGFYYVFYTVRIWCLRKGFCGADIEMVRGKMAITSTKRVLIWKTNLIQKKLKDDPWTWKCLAGCCKSCKAPLEYTSETSSRSYNINMINDIEIRLNQQKSVLCGLCCCSQTYESSVRVRFGEFTQDAPSFASFRTLPTRLYKALCENTFAGGTIDWFALAYDLMNALTFGPDDLHWVDIVSERRSEMECDLENQYFEGSYARLSEIAKKITALITEKRAPTWKAPSDTTGLMPAHEVSVSGHQDFAKMDLVKADSCGAPEIYVPLGPEEKIIATSADMYLYTFMDKLTIFLSVVWCVLLVILIGIMHASVIGLAFVAPFLKGFVKCVTKIAEIRAKRMSRNGFILTTHRIIHISIWRKDTIMSVCCPSFLLCCFPTQEEAVIRSVFPKRIESGIISRKGKVLTAYILTNAGAIGMSFDLTNLKSAADLMNAESRISKRLAFFKACFYGMGRAKVVDGQASAELEGGIETKALPLISDEKILMKYVGKIYSDSCEKTCSPEGPPCCRQLEGCCTIRRSYHPGCCLFWTCGIKPMYSKTAILVSDASVYAYKADENEPKCGPCCTEGGFCYNMNKVTNWSVYWTPLSAIAGSEVWSVLHGREAFCTRCWYGTFCGNNCCPMLKSEARASLVLQDMASPATVTVQAKELDMFDANRDKKPLVDFRQGIAKVQGLMTAQNVNTMA